MQKPGETLATIGPSLGVVTYEEYGFSPLSAYLAQLGRRQTSSSEGSLARSSRYPELGEIPGALVALPAKMVRKYVEPAVLCRHLTDAVELVASWGAKVVVLDLAPCENQPHVLLGVGMMAGSCKADVLVRFQYEEARVRADADDG